MKRSIVFLVILLSSLKSFSQTATNKDSLICLPKSTLTKVTQDLVKCDGEREEMVILKNNLDLQSSYIHKQDSIIGIQTIQINDLKMVNTAYQQIDTAHVSIAKALNENVNVYRKERNWYRIAAVILLIVAIVK